jgi:hypothetical protein
MFIQICFVSIENELIIFIEFVYYVYLDLFRIVSIENELIIFIEFVYYVYLDLFRIN